MSTEKVIQLVGEPTWKSPSEYGYEWWTYEGEEQTYKQIGIQDGQVVTAVFLGGEATIEGMAIGQDYNRIKSDQSFQSTFALESEGAYRFELTSQDLKERPLVEIDEQWTAQLYFDTFINKLAAIRLIRNDVLLKMQPYKTVYRGVLPRSLPLERDEWEEVETGMEKQIISQTNHFRHTHNLSKLIFHKQASNVAFLHSRDMDEKNYFSHYAPDGKGLEDRMQGISYQEAGENIAAQYVDATAAVHGWLNSAGHREALLNSAYTHLGVGVYHRYYTQNFLTLP
nr:CAP domain-containing protein [Halobacillus locisalis]